MESARSFGKILLKLKCCEVISLQLIKINEKKKVGWSRSIDFVVAMCSGKQTHSEGQCREWSAIYYTGGTKAESPLSQGLRPVFVKTLYTLKCVSFPETSLSKGKRKIQPKLTHDSFALSLGS